MSVRANGGTAPYTWTAPGSSFFDPDGDHAAARYNNNGTYEITVRDAAGLTDVCALDINNRPRRRRTPTPDPALEIEKVVRNVTQGISEREAVTARPGDTVEFRIEVSSTGSSTAKAVTVRDTLPDRLTYVTGSTTIDDKTAPDGIIGSGLSLGDMPEDTSKVIRFRATVAGASAFTHTTTILSNFAYARGSNVPEVNDMAHVSVEIGAPVTQIKTGPGESTVLALIIASIITLLYVGYTGTDTFRRRELEENIDIARRDKDGFNFKR